MSLVGFSIICFGLLISALSIITRPGTFTKPADRDAHETKDKNQ